MDEAIARAREAAGEALSAEAAKGNAGNTWEDTQVVLDAFLASLSSQGRVIVPREATQPMCDAAAKVYVGDWTITKIWSAMLSAAGGGD